MRREVIIHRCYQWIQNMTVEQFFRCVEFNEEYCEVCMDEAKDEWIQLYYNLRENRRIFEYINSKFGVIRDEYKIMIEKLNYKWNNYNVYALKKDDKDINKIM